MISKKISQEVAEKLLSPIYTALILNGIGNTTNRNIILRDTDYKEENLSKVYSKNGLFMDMFGIKMIYEALISNNVYVSPDFNIEQFVEDNIFTINVFNVHTVEEFNDYRQNDSETEYNLIFLKSEIYDTFFNIAKDPKVIEDFEFLLQTDKFDLNDNTSLYYSISNAASRAYISLLQISELYKKISNFNVLEKNSSSELILDSIYLNLLMTNQYTKSREKMNFIVNFDLEPSDLIHIQKEKSGNKLNIYPEPIIKLYDLVLQNHDSEKVTWEVLYDFIHRLVGDISFQYVNVNDYKTLSNILDRKYGPVVSVIKVSNEMFLNLKYKQIGNYTILDGEDDGIEYSLPLYLSSIKKVRSNITEKYSLFGYDYSTFGKQLNEVVYSILVSGNKEYNIILPYGNQVEYKQLSKFVQEFSKNFKFNKEDYKEAFMLTLKESERNKKYEFKFDGGIEDLGLSIHDIQDELDLNYGTLIDLSTSSIDLNIVLTNLKNLEEIIPKSYLFDKNAKDKSAILNVLSLNLFKNKNYNQIMNPMYLPVDYDYNKTLQKIKDSIKNNNGFLEEINNSAEETEEILNNYENDIKEKKKSDGKYKILKESTSTIRFKDLIGLNKQKQDLIDLGKIYQEPIEELKKFKIEREKGFILYGLPGVGKTMIAKAFANEIPNSKFIYLSMEQIMADKTGTERGLTVLSKELKAFSTENKTSTVILFLDEIDSLRARGNSAHNNSFYDGFTNEMLYIIDNLPSNVVLIGATNYVDNLDPALIRQGRLGKKIEIKNNFKKEDVHKFITDNFTESNMKKYIKDILPVTNMIYYMNGSEISGVLNKLKQKLYFRNKEKSKKQDMDKLIIDTVYSEKYSLDDFKLTDEEMLSTAYHEAGHAFMYLKYYDIKKLHEISIYPTKETLGFVSYKFDKQDVTKNDLEKLILISLAGRYAEKLITNNISTGASSDLESANKKIDELLTKYGMGEVENFSKGKREMSEYQISKINKEHEEILRAMSSRCEKIISENKEVIEMIANDLVDKKVIIDNFEKYSILIDKEI